jgi:hypothetical protein
MAKYLVTQSPGYPSAHGFVRPGGTVILPDDTIPSRYFHPLDEAAHKALTKAKKEYVEDLERRMSELEPPRKLSVREKKELLAVPDLPKPEAEPVVENPEDEGQTIREVAFERGELDPAAPAQHKGGGKRAADSK